MGKAGEAGETRSDCRKVVKYRSLHHFFFPEEFCWKRWYGWFVNWRGVEKLRRNRRATGIEICTFILIFLLGASHYKFSKCQPVNELLTRTSVMHD